ncbi:alanine racemase [bacterium]|nr:alanine racemase [bacterium]
MPELTIDLSAIHANVKLCRALLRPETQLCLLLKCDAYGHGFSAVAESLAGRMPDYVAIETNAEAQLLCSLYPSLPILRLYAAGADDTRAATAWNVEETIVDAGHAELLSRIARETGRPIRVHVDVDTGMGRLGILYDSAVEAILAIARMPGLELAGVMTHCPVADDPDDGFTRLQHSRMIELRKALALAGLRPKLHMAASAAIFVSPEYHLDMVRLGLIAYGGYPTPRFRSLVTLTPTMQWEARIVTLRELPAGWSVGYGRTHILERPARIATLDVGYSHGYLRDFSGKGEVLVHGRRAPVVGRVSMNLTTIDVSAVPEARVYDSAVLLGRQGGEEISCDELAAWGNTIPNEIMTMTGKQNARRYAMGRIGPMRPVSPT